VISNANVISPRLAHRPYTYVYLVENVRENVAPSSASLPISGAGKWSSRVIDLDRLARSVARLAQRSMVPVAGRGEPRPMRCAGGSDRGCCSSGCGRRLAAARYWRFWPDNASSRLAPERGTFLTVSPAVCVGLGRAAEKWRADYRIDALRAPAASSLPRMPGSASRSPIRPGQRAGGRAAARTSSREELFARRLDLFAELSVVFMDTTSLSSRERA